MNVGPGLAARPRRLTGLHGPVPVARAAAVVLAAVAGLQGAAAARAGSVPTDPRIAVVERSLLPVVVTDATQALRLDQRMARYGVPGVSVAVVDQGRLAWVQAWGLAQAGQAVPLTPKTLMQAGSVSKSLTALGALKLAEQGRLDLDADVNTLLRRWQLPAGAQTAERPVTVRGLLGHTAGLTVHGFPGHVPGQPLPSLVQLLDGVPPARNEPVRASSVPGSEWRYSGGGYVLLQALIEDRTGEPFAGWMRREVLRPAGMAHSRFGRLPRAPLAQAAAGHQDGRVIEGRRADKVEEAAGGLWSTPTDLARLSLGLQRVMAGQAQPWLAPARLAEALKRPAQPGARTGLGFMLHGSDAFGHDGRNVGFDTRWWMDRDRAVVIMVNGNAFELIAEIQRAVAVAHGWVDLAPTRLSLEQLQAALDTSTLYLRGSMNNWNARTALTRLDGRQFQVDVDLPAGRHEYKFASADWQAVDLGASEAGPLVPGGENLVLEVSQPGRYRFSLDASQVLAPAHHVQRLSS